MRIAVDREKCIGNGMCAALAPDYFEVSNEGDLDVLMHDVRGADVDDVQGAALSCPAAAIRLKD
jgi:ferredoxin